MTRRPGALPAVVLLGASGTDAGAVVLPPPPAVVPARGVTPHSVTVGSVLDLTGPLAAEGVLLIGSGHMTHNLAGRVRGGPPAGYAREFQRWVHERILGRDHEALAAYRERAPHARPLATPRTSGITWMRCSPRARFFAASSTGCMSPISPARSISC